MVYLFVFLFITFSIGYIIQRIAKFLLRKFFNDKPNTTIRNPYIDYHKAKMQNDKNYDEYLDWLKKDGYGVPVEKVEAPEDKEADKKIRRLFPSKKFTDNDKLF